MKDKTRENIQLIAHLIVQMKKYNGYKIGHNVDIFMMNTRAKIIELSDNEVSIDFNGIDNNICVGTYNIYIYYSDSEVEEVFKGADGKLFYRLNNYIEEE